MNGYATAYIGKNHETPAWTVSAAGPFDLWPTQSGFDKFYGFIGDEQHMWYPAIFDGTSSVDIDYNDPNFHLQEDFAREAVEWVQDQKSRIQISPSLCIFQQVRLTHQRNISRNTKVSLVMVGMLCGKTLENQKKLVL